jgi:hypothetical protein
MLIGMALLLPCALAAQSSHCQTIDGSAVISQVGAFSNMRYSDEHAYGYSVMLWRSGDCLFGLFESSDGLAGDSPIGELRNVAYDSMSGGLKFSAKLSMGVVGAKSSRDFEPSRDLFTFDGSIHANTVTGVIRHAVQNTPNTPRTRVDVVLRTSPPARELMGDATTFGKWLEVWRPILQRRGPKW